MGCRRARPTARRGTEPGGGRLEICSFFPETSTHRRSLLWGGGSIGSRSGFSFDAHRMCLPSSSSVILALGSRSGRTPDPGSSPYHLRDALVWAVSFSSPGLFFQVCKVSRIQLLLFPSLGGDSFSRVTPPWALFAFSISWLTVIYIKVFVTLTS